MKIHAFQLGQIGTNAYLVLPDNTDEAILVDCPLEASDEIPIFLEKVGRKLSAILLTHGHWDHVWDTCSLASHDILILGECKLCFIPFCDESFSWTE